MLPYVALKEGSRMIRPRVTTVAPTSGWRKGNADAVYWGICLNS